MAYKTHCSFCCNYSNRQLDQVEVVEDSVAGWKYSWHLLPGSATGCPNSGRPVSEEQTAALNDQRSALGIAPHSSPLLQSVPRTGLDRPLQFNSRLSEMAVPGLEIMEEADAVACAKFPPSHRIHLTIGAPPAAPPQAILDLVSQGAKDPGKQSYNLPPYGSPKLLSAFAAFRHRVDHITSDPADQICAAYGGREALLDVIQAITEAGDVVIGPGLGYPGNVFAAVNARCQYVTYSVLPNTDLREEIPAAFAAGSALGRVKVLIVVPVGNPFGSAIPDEVYPWLIDWALTNGVAILSDEAYLHSLFENERVSVIRHYAGADDISISINTMSKLYNVPGWRMALLDGHRGWIAATKRVVSSKFYGHYLPFQDAAIEAMQPSYDSFFQHCGAEYGHAFAAAKETLAQYGVDVLEKTVGGMFATIKCDGCHRLPASDSITVTAELFKATGVRLNPGVWHGKEGDSVLRLALISNVENTRVACHRIGAFLASARGVARVA